MHYEVIIVGSGAAGLSAAIYLSRAGIKTLVTGDQNRSQLKAAYDVENYFGFCKGITGRELLRSGTKQAKSAGADIIQKNVKSIEEKNKKFYVNMENGNIRTADFLIIASGMLSSLNFASALKLKKNKKLIKIDNQNKTSHKRVYAAGNCCTSVRQIAKDVGDGCNAAINIIKTIKNQSNYTDYGPINSGLGPNNK